MSIALEGIETINPIIYPPGCVAIAGSDLSRYTGFTVSLVGTYLPTGTTVSWITSSGVARNMNEAVQRGLDGGAAWFWCLGDDHVFAPNTLLRLLEHLNETRHIVAPLCLHRKDPFNPVVYQSRNVKGQFTPWPMHTLPLSGVHEVTAAGGAGMLVSRLVFETMLSPWFDVGQIDPQDSSDDLHFQVKAQQLGFKMYVDFDTTIGHLTPMAVWPRKNKEGQWEVGLDTAAGLPGVK